MSAGLEEYRAILVAAEQKAQEDYDKAVLSLSGGAIAVSFAFISDVLEAFQRGPVHNRSLLVGAWVVWGVSITTVLASFFMSHLALRRAIRQLDTGSIYSQRPGGAYDLVTAGLNAVGGLCFFAGVLLLAAFVTSNFG